ncbi:MAG: hypothetical protein J07HN6_02511 [Halonotius sp. J07HN6]|jgi:FOG: WD40-like repeat|nr:MAG: hypothetical protein J07HN6_02511 [Halonotius sp. J07HN6]
MSEKLESEGAQQPISTRRAALKLAASTVTALTLVDPVTAQPERQQWAFETGDRVESSPTVVDGTAYIGSNDTNLYAVDAASGKQQWAFKTSDKVQSPPTVVDGTVFVGSDDGNLYAIDTDIKASSEGSRVLLGTLGHHGQVGGKIPAKTAYGAPGFGALTAITGLTGAGYVLRSSENQSDSE